MEATIKTLATKDDFANVKYELCKEMIEVKGDTIKWMFIFWVSQIAATLSIVFLYLRN